MKQQKVKFIKEYIVMIVEVLIFVYFINTFILQVFAIPSSSMENNMLIGDHLLVDKVRHSGYLGLLDSLILAQGEIRRGDIVTFKSPPEIRAKNYEKIWYVKRVVGLPGETIYIKNREVYINNKKINEEYTLFKYNTRSIGDFPLNRGRLLNPEFPEEFAKYLLKSSDGYQFKIPENSYFCMGDNRDQSSDSRIWGPVPRQNIVGKPWRVLWSVAREGGLDTKPTFFDQVKSLLFIIPDFVVNTRWKRTLLKYH